MKLCALEMEFLREVVEVVFSQSAFCKIVYKVNSVTCEYECL